jgi:16S rRNA (adenine1518-N6/adenine1519-N6)-dimethyltransferase
MTSPKVWLNARNIRAKKTLGQHFLADAKIAEKIVMLAGIGADETVLEIGAGLGALTLPAAGRAKRVIAVEADPRLVATLTTTIALKGASNVTIVEGSILDVDLEDFTHTTGEKLVVLGNLPYHISTPILVRLVAARNAFSRAVIMLQKEVAERLTASPGDKARSRLSILIQYCAAVKVLLDVSPRVFFPKPKVASRVVEIAFRASPRLGPDAETHLFRIVRAAFGKRRKTLKNALSQSDLGLDMETADRVLENAGIDPMRRAETLEVADFIKLVAAVEAASSGP